MLGCGKRPSRGRVSCLLSRGYSAPGWGLQGETTLPQLLVGWGALYGEQGWCRDSGTWLAAVLSGGLWEQLHPAGAAAPGQVCLGG